MNYLQSSFYEQNTVVVARSLLGALLVHRIGDQIVSGYIVETEAYCADDEACHAHNGRKTVRNAALFGPVAHAYVYLSYGMHFCINVVSREPQISAGGILIRALQPVDGIDLMKKLRNKTVEKELTNGPGKLGQALGITLADNGTDLLKSDRLFIAKGIEVADTAITASPRIGISKAKKHLWRFHITGNTFVSR